MSKTIYSKITKKEHQNDINQTKIDFKKIEDGMKN
jgi:hypothetical protein